jgi:hypothetical protein
MRRLSPEGFTAATAGRISVVLILQPDEPTESEDLPILRDCLTQAGLGWVESHAHSLPAGEFSALIVRGSIPIRGYLTPHTSSTEPLDQGVREIIRAFFDAGKPIAAPCMGLAIVIEALADLLPRSLVLTPESPSGPIAVYSALRLVTTHRPLIGRTPAEISHALTQVVSNLQRLLMGHPLPC